MLDMDAFISDRRLLIELHPGRDGRADHRDECQQIALIELERWNDGLVEHLQPVRMDEEAAKDIAHIDKAEEEQHTLNILVVAAQDQEPHDHSGARHTYQGADAEDS